MISIWEVGARGALKAPIQKLQTFATYVGFEPDSVAFKIKRDMLEREYSFKKTHLFQAALHDKSGETELYYTRHAGCSSLLQPNLIFLNKYHGYRYAPGVKKGKGSVWDEQFTVIKTFNVPTMTYQEAVSLCSSPPNLLQIDTQGTELNIIKGCTILENVCFIDIELMLKEIYVKNNNFLQTIE